MNFSGARLCCTWRYIWHLVIKHSTWKETVPTEAGAELLRLRCIDLCMEKKKTPATENKFPYSLRQRVRFVAKIVGNGVGYISGR